MQVLFKSRHPQAADLRDLTERRVRFELRLRLVRLCVELAESDAHVAAGESIVLVAAVEHWGLHREMFRSSPGN